MKVGRSMANIPGSNWEPDDIEFSENECEERTLILKAAPPSRRAQLMAHGVKEIRCACCDRVRPLVGAEDTDEGWVCENCVLEMTVERRYGGQRGR